MLMLQNIEGGFKSKMSIDNQNLRFYRIQF
jgi:hypothetical protein